MTALELQGIFDEDTDKSYLMRSIIMSEVKYPGVTYTRSLRSLWYSVVKPTLDKLGLLTSTDQTEEGLTKWDATLSRYVADLLRRGFLTYRDLHVLDNSRQRSNPRPTYYTTDIAIYGYKATIAPYSNIIIATEKDTVYDNIHDIAQLFGCSCISCKGQNSLGAMEALVRGIVSAQKDNLFEINILTMTDYDPAGYYIAEALEAQVKDVLSALDIYHVEVSITRVGITPDQLDEDMVEANKYSPKPANLDKWLDRTGGIDGEPYGLELDALEPRQIREIFVNHLLKYVDTSVYEEHLKESFVRRVGLEIMAPKVERILSRLVVYMEDEIELKGLDIRDLAIKGDNTLPTYGICERPKAMENMIGREILTYFERSDLGGPEDAEILDYDPDTEEYD